MAKPRIDRATVRTRAHHNRREIWLAVVLTLLALAVIAGVIAWPKG